MAFAAVDEMQRSRQLAGLIFIAGDRSGAVYVHQDVIPGVTEWILNRAARSYLAFILKAQQNNVIVGVLGIGASAVHRDAEYRIGYLPAETDLAAQRSSCPTRTSHGGRRRTDRIASVDELPASTAAAAINIDVRTASLAKPHGQTSDSCGQQYDDCDTQEAPFHSSRPGSELKPLDGVHGTQMYAMCLSS
ncbi:hypothetical protein [Bradyrhizobium sp. USDA 4473]